MATYTAITDAEIDQDSPITQTLMTKYRDNLTASIEGDDTAPRILSPALGLTYKAGTASRSSSGSSTIVSLTTADLSNLADMTLALITGTILVQPSSGQTISGSISVTVGGTIVDLERSDSNDEEQSFAYLAVLSSNTSVTASLTQSGSGGNVSAAAQILILGR